ncbi:MAG: TonB family protein [Flavobacteriaceae bacterium]|nr:TonB family protein [Flavobacteriaceae bacterium]
MITYILESLAFQLVFLLAYDLFLKKETFFQWNRAYLLCTFALSLILPWVKVQAFQTTMPQGLETTTVFLTQLNGVVLGPGVDEASFLERIPWPYLVLGAGSILAASWFVIKLYQIARLRKKGEVKYFKDFTKIIVPKSVTAFSFFRNIFMGDGIHREKEANILAHELVHVKQLHSLDLLFFELSRIIFWFNPLVYIYQKRVAELHEFIADEKAVKQNKEAHFEMLLSEAFHTQNISFVNQFFNRSLIKKRIVMLQKKKSKAVWQLKYVLLLPLVLGMLLYTSCQLNKEDNGLESVDGVSLAVANEIPFGVIDEVPVFPGCENAEDKRACFQEKIQAHIRKHFNYPDEAQAFGIQGRVSAIFVMDEEGKVVDINMRGPHELLEEETKRILAKLPQMQPGKHEGKTVKVPFSIPITFRLQGNDEKEVSKQRGERIGIPFANVDEVPIFPGCEDADDKKACFNEQIVKHIKKHFNYPKKAQEMGIQGRVSVIFMIGKDGMITDIRKRGPHELLENEALRIIERLPQMQPGKHVGEEVEVSFSIPITFRLNDENDKTSNNSTVDHMQIDGLLVKKNTNTVYEGVVKDSKSLGIPGVNISIEGKSSGVVSDFNGVFSIEAEKGDVVKFQYIGLPDKLVQISNW